MDTPDTSFYMNLGFALTFIVMGIYVASLYLRSRNLRRDMDMLEAMQESEKNQTK